MAKGKSTINNDNRYPSDSSIEKDTYKGSEKEKNNDTVPPSDQVTLVYKKNKKKELKIGREMFTFWGPSSQKVPRSVIEHPDFQSQSKYFLVKEE